MHKIMKKKRKLDDMSVVFSFAAAVFMTVYIFSEKKQENCLAASICCQAVSSLLSLMRRNCCGKI